MPSTMDVVPDRKSKSTKSAPLRVCIIDGAPLGHVLLPCVESTKEIGTPA